VGAGIVRVRHKIGHASEYDVFRHFHWSDAASDPTRIGSDQVRGVRFEGERMVLIPPPRLTGESEEHREITWERIAAE
jgi:hypothetical protein